MIVNFDEFNSIPGIFYHQANDLKDQPYLWKKENDKYVSLSWSQVKEQVESLATYLKDLGILEGDRVLILSENRPEWQITDLAIMSIGAISVPAYTTSTTNDYKYIIEHSGARCAIVSSHELMKKVLPAIEKISHCQNVIKINDDNETYTEVVNILSYNKIINDSLEKSKASNEIEELSKNFKRKDTACIIYTSGTGGNPKGVMLSHGAMLRNCASCDKLLESLTSDLKKEIRYLSWLPLSHSYEHTVQFVQIAIGAEVYYAESIDKLIKNMGECSPDIMTAVPRFYQNLYQKINSTFNKATGFKKSLINKMLYLGEKVLTNQKLTFFEKVQNTICEKIVRKKIKAQFGGSLKAFISGGGALDKEVGVFLNSIGLPTLQGYGLTETSPVVSCNPIKDIRIDTVGPAFSGNEVKIADDGEILVKGENVMLGYWNKKEETEKVLKDGWLYTGDIGHFENGYLKITDRKKDILITPGGDNISPVKIENDLLKIEFVEQALVYGDNKPYLIAILVLNNNSSNISDENISKEIETINKNLSKIEKIKKFFVIKDQFTIENGLMTPTLKLKRYKIIKKYKNELEKLY